MWTYNEAKPVAQKLNAKIVGSVRSKGRSNHDLDLLVKEYNNEIGGILESMGYECIGSQVVSPDEIKKSRKFGKNVGSWLRNRGFKNRQNNKIIEVWNIEEPINEMIIKRSKFKQLIKEILKEVLSNQNDKAKTEHFSVEFGSPDVVKSAAKIWLNGNVWFANTLPVAKDWNPKYAGKWYINRHVGALELKFPSDWNKYYNTVQELLNDLEEWYNSKKEPLNERMGCTSGEWVEPNGTVHDVCDNSHWEWADSYLKTNGPNRFKDDPIQEMIARGWMRVIYSSPENLIMVMVGNRRNNYLTRKQKEHLEDQSEEMNWAVYDDDGYEMYRPYECITKEKPFGESTQRNESTEPSIGGSYSDQSTGVEPYDITQLERDPLNDPELTGKQDRIK